MNKLHFPLIFLLITINLIAKQDSLFVKIIDDTVQVWNTNVSANCAAQFTSEILFFNNNNITITECDKKKQALRCICNFDLHVSFTGLAAGQYNITVYRQELKEYLYLKDTTIDIGELNFTLENSSALKDSSFFEQSDCHSYFEESNFTSAYWYPAAVSATKNMHNEAEARSIYSDEVLLDGTAEKWNYKFSWYDQTNSHSEYIYFHTDLNHVIFDSVSLIEDCCVMNITEAWFDSDSAIAYAESNGGKIFREQNPNYIIEASLSQALVPYSYPCWSVNYLSKIDSNKKFSLYFDARKNSSPTISYSTIDPLPKEYSLLQNYPNPFNPTTTIKYDLPKESKVQLIIYNILGKKMDELVNTIQKPGGYEINWNAKEFASGIYIYQIKANNFISSKKLVLLK